MASSIIDGALQAGKQARQNRHALRQARVEEQAEKNREQLRIQKEAEKRQKQEAQRAKRDEEKALKKAAAEAAKAKKAQEKAAQPKVPKAKAKGAARRRGRGHDELVEGDAGCLVNWLPNFECPVVDSYQKLLEGMVQGIPTIWRARRPPFRKVLEMDGGITEAKELNHACAKLHAERQAFTSEFAQLCESEPDRTKKTKNAPAELQAFTEALTMDGLMQALLEEQIEKRRWTFRPSW